MELAAALGLGDRELVSFVGAGGKKTAMRQLVAEANMRGLEAGYTTSTHMPPPPELPLVLAHPDDIRSEIEGAMAPFALARDRVTEPKRVDEKVRGFDPDVMSSLFAERVFDWLLVKADGARMREFKAPGPNEPPIPRASTYVVPVVSVHAVGQPLTDDIVHRVERVKRCADIAEGDPLTPEIVGQILAHPDGGLKRVPNTATVVPLLNKADDSTLTKRAHRVVSAAFEYTSRFDRALICSFEANRLIDVTRERSGQ